MFYFNGVNLPSTGMWLGEVFAISDCLVGGVMLCSPQQTVPKTQKQVNYDDFHINNMFRYIDMYFRTEVHQIKQIQHRH